MTYEELWAEVQKLSRKMNDQSDPEVVAQRIKTALEADKDTVIQHLRHDIDRLQAISTELATRAEELHNLLARIYRANYVPTADETFPNQEEIEKALGIGKETK